MDDFLGKLYCGEVRPNEGCGRHHSEMLVLERRCSRMLEELNGEISEKAREDLQKYIETKREISFFAEVDAFTRGVGFTAQFLVSALE